MKYFLLPTIVILPDGDAFLLFRAETGTLLRLNRSGAWLCGQLSRGLEESELPALLRAAGAPESAQREAADFLAMLRKKELLMGENGEGRISAADFFRRDRMPEKITPDSELWEDSPLYDISGMKGEFSGRESLRLLLLPPEKFSAGDILLYDAGVSGCAGKVRRLLRRTKREFIVSGDAKGSPQERIPVEKPCSLVTEKLFPGSLRRRVARGFAGKIRHAFFFLTSALAAPAEKSMEFLLPLMFWRLPMKLLIFHREGWFCFRKKRIAVITGRGYCYQSPWYRLLYRIPAHLYQLDVPRKEYHKK